MSIRNTDTKVYFYKNDYNRVCAEIYRHPHIETGGNLFGLWTTERNVVVHAALGPGKNCKRTDVSFHQDIEYMSRVGTFLNQKFMLCHIGEWHSHHHLTLNEPSSGDKRTIRHNYPEGVKKFLVIIGNIVGNDRVVLSPYFFSENGKTCEKGIYEVLDADSAFTTDSMIAEVMNDGAETPNHPYCSSFPNKDQQQSAPECGGHSQPSATVIEVMDTGAEDTGANGHSRQSVQPVISNLGDVSPRAVTHCTESTTLEIRNPPPDYQTSTISQPTVTRSPSERTGTATPPDSAMHLPASNDPSTTNSASATCTKSNEDNKQTRKEAILEKVFDEIKSKFNTDSGIHIERSTDSGVIEMKFKHVGKHWFIRFPESFPEKSARIFTSYSENFSDSRESYSSRPVCLNNYIDILLAIKIRCSFISSNCSSCKKMNVQNLAQSKPTLDFFLTEEGNCMIKQLWNKAKDTLADTGTLKKEMKYDDILENAILEVSFTHSSALWIIQVNSTFPGCPAEVYCEKQMNIYGLSKNFVNCKTEQYSSKDWALEVLHAIMNACACAKCKGFQLI